MRRGGQHAAWRPELYRAHRLLKARERLSERERRRLSVGWYARASGRHHRRLDKVEAE